MSITKGITDGKFRRYFSESVIWRFSEKIQLIPSVNPLVIKNIITEGYTDEMKRIIFFFTNGFTDGKKITDERFTDRAFPSVIPSEN
jgi:hypothetical protein